MTNTLMNSAQYFVRVVGTVLCLQTPFSNEGLTPPAAESAAPRQPSAVSPFWAGENCSAPSHASP